jgi:hypothetical protein
MTKTRDRVYDAALNVRPYVERAMRDEQLRNDVLHAFSTARELYDELVGGRRAVSTVATRVATDDDVRDKLKVAIEDLRRAAARLQGKRDHSGRNTALLILGIALAVLFNPITGPEARKWVKNAIGGGSDEFGEYSSNGGANPNPS